MKPIAHSIAELRTMLEYSPETGLFVWKAKRIGHNRVGRVAGTLSSIGYINIRIRPNAIKAHRLAWAFMTGNWPDGVIDHINGVRNDNRFCNLRSVTLSVNRQNTRYTPPASSGLVGATRRGNRYAAIIEANGVRHRLGCFDTAEEASAAYLRARAELHSAPIREATQDV